jgi:hypothetical protein
MLREGSVDTDEISFCMLRHQSGLLYPYVCQSVEFDRQRVNPDLAYEESSIPWCCLHKT